MAISLTLYCAGPTKHPVKNTEMKRGQTPSQTIGPFFAYGLTPEQYGFPFTQIASGRIEAQGETIKITGQVLDGNGDPVIDALVEIWQPGIGFARQGTGARSDCSFEFETVKPSAASPSEAPHINVIVFMRGLLSHLYTRIYFEDETAANAVDDVLLNCFRGSTRDLDCPSHAGRTVSL